MYLNCSAQIAQQHFIDEEGEVVSTLDSAVVIRKIQYPAKGSLVSFEDFHKDGKIIRKGAGYFFKDVLKFHGDFVLYNNDGSKSAELRFEHGNNNGVISEYLSDGILFKKYELVKPVDSWDYDRTAAMINKIPNWGYEIKKLYYLADSNENVLLQNGNGFLKEKANYLGTEFIEEGFYKNGLRSGWWIGKTKDGTKIYEDYYSKGRFKRGRWLDNSEQKSYSNLFTGPDYKYHNNPYYGFIFK